MKRIIYLISLLLPVWATAQQLPVNSHFFVNPYFINPSYAGVNGQTEVFVTHRQNMEMPRSAPVTTSLTMHLPTRGKVAFGVNLSDHVYNLLGTATNMVTVGYALPLGENHFLRAGLSAGFSKYTVDRNRLESDADWDRISAFNNKSSLDAQFGISYQLKGLTVGVSAPTLLNKRLVNVNPDDALDFTRVGYYNLNGGYHLKLSESFAVAPQVQYRYSTQFPSQYQAMGTLYFRNLWAGGGYRQNAGPVAAAGVKIKNTLSVGYAYEPAAKAATTIGGTHELMLSLSFGQKKEKQTAEEKQKQAEKKAEEKAAKEKAENSAKAREAAKKLAKKEKAADKADQEKSRKKEKAQKEKAKKDRSKQKAAEAKQAKAAREKAKKDKAKADRDSNSKAAVAKPARQATPVVEKPAEEEVKPATLEAQPTAKPKEEERIEVQKRSHPLELKKGNYVVVGSFNVFENAVRFTHSVYKRGMRSDYRYSSKTMRYYVYVYQSGDVDEARGERDRVRQLMGISDAWVLIVE
jgi:type IX secretion system PorP/SprF family membrane protein